MYSVKVTPLNAELNHIRNTFGSLTFANKLSDDEFSEFAGTAIALGIAPLYEDLPEGRYAIAGGIIRSLFENEIPTDVDIFLLGSVDSIKTRMQKIADEKSERIRKVKVGYDGFTKHIWLIDIKPYPTASYVIQLIGQWFTRDSDNNVTIFQHSEDVIACFDLISTCFAVDLEITPKSSISYHVNKVIHHPLLYKCLAKRELRVNPYGPPELKKMRADRFYKYIVEYGYRVPDQGELMQFNLLLSRGDLSVESDYS